MAEMTSAERVMCVLRREQPDRVPHFEWLMAKHVREALCPGCKTHNEFAVRMGHDAYLVGPDFHKEQIAPGRWLSEWGYVAEYGKEEHGVEVESPIATMADFEAYTPPDPLAPGRYDSLEKAVKEFKGKMAIGVHLNDVFSLPRYLMGMQSLLMAIAGDPNLVRGLIEMSVEINTTMCKEVARRGADFVWTGDDYAYDKGPFMSPKSFREIFAGPLKRVVGAFKATGLPMIKHTDGKLWTIMDMILDAGIDCLDPIDPLSGMDLGEVKEKLGDRVALKGNVDCVQTLVFGTTDEVVAETKEALRKGGPGGGYILSSSNSIHSSVKPENYLAMLETVKEFGKYPLKV